MYSKHIYSQLSNLISQHISINPFPSPLLFSTLPLTMQKYIPTPSVT